MPIRYVTYNTDTMPAGDRVIVLNGDDPPLFIPLNDLLPKEPEKMYFQDLKYIEVPYSNGISFEVWEVLNDEHGYEYSKEITNAIEIYKRSQEGHTILILKCDNPIKKGYLLFNKY